MGNQACCAKDPSQNPKFLKMKYEVEKQSHVVQETPGITPVQKLNLYHDLAIVDPSLVNELYRNLVENQSNENETPEGPIERIDLE